MSTVKNNIPHHTCPTFVFQKAGCFQVSYTDPGFWMRNLVENAEIYRSWSWAACSMLPCLRRAGEQNNLQIPLPAFNRSDFDSVSCSIYCRIWVELQQSSLKAEEFINASEGTMWPFSKQNKAMKAKKSSFLENVALKMRVTIPDESCRSRILSSQKHEDGKVELYHPAAGSMCISIALHIAGRRWNLLSTANWLLPMELHVRPLVVLLWNR